MLESLNFWSPIFFWNSITNIALAFFSVVWIFSVRWALRLFFDSKLKKIIDKSKTRIDDIVYNLINKFFSVLFVILWIYLVKISLVFPVSLDVFLSKSIWVIVVLVVIYIIQQLTTDLINDHFKKTSNKEEKYFSSLIKNVFNILIWTIWVSLVLSKLWYDISTLVAGIWISGIAIALAIQPTLASIFASFFIFLDKPFKIWDMVTIWNYSWTIKDIGLRSTRMILFNWNEVVFPNTQIANSWIENISQRRSIRNDALLWLTYDTSSKKMEKAIEIIRKILSSKIEIDDTDIRLYFKNFWDYSLNLSLTYFISDSLWLHERYSLISDINFEIKKSFEKNKIEFAFPTQTIYSIKS